MALNGVEVIIIRVGISLLLLERMEMMFYAVGYTRDRIAGLDSRVLEGVGVVLRERRVIIVDVSESIHLVRLQIE